VSGELDLAVPSLWFFEAGNTLSRRFGRRLGAELLKWLLELALPEVLPAGGWGARAVSLVAEHGVTFYDASYLAVALDLGGTLVTADTAFLRRIGKGAGAVSLQGFSL